MPIREQYVHVRYTKTDLYICESKEPKHVKIVQNICKETHTRMSEVIKDLSKPLYVPKR